MTVLNNDDKPIWNVPVNYKPHVWHEYPNEKPEKEGWYAVIYIGWFNSRFYGFWQLSDFQRQYDKGLEIKMWTELPEIPEKWQ